MKDNVYRKARNVSSKVVDGAKKVKKVKMVDEFREFIARGNVLDLAVGVIIGAAFQSLVTSLTENLISPILGCLTEVDFSEYVLKIGTLKLKYGAFLTDVINFIIMAFIVFLIVKVMNKVLTKKKEDAPVEDTPQAPTEAELLTEIRDLLKEKTK